MAFLSIRRTAQSVIAVAVSMRRGWPARQASPKKSLSPNIPIVASLPVFETTVSLIFARLDIKHRVSGIPLREDCLLLRKEHDTSCPRQ